MSARPPKVREMLEAGPLVHHVTRRVDGILSAQPAVAAGDLRDRIRFEITGAR